MHRASENATGGVYNIRDGMVGSNCPAESGRSRINSLLGTWEMGQLGIGMYRTSGQCYGFLEGVGMEYLGIPYNRVVFPAI